MSWSPDHPPVEINGIDDLPEFDEAFLKSLEDSGNGSIGFNNSWTIDWTRFYECLETEGWDMQDLGGPADNKIRRVVRKMVQEGVIQ